MTWILWLTIALLSLNPILTVFEIGKEREPISPMNAGIGLILNGLLIAGIILFH